MYWFLLRTRSALDCKFVCVQAANKDEAISKAKDATLDVTLQHWGPYDTLAEVTAKERYCNFERGRWIEQPISHKKYKDKYVKLEDFINQPNVIVLEACTA